MIRKVLVTNHLGESLEMVLERPWDSGFNITGIENLGAPEADLNFTEVATGDGAVFNSARANKRNIVMHIAYWAKPDIETSRQRSYRFFTVKKPVTLTFVTDNRSLSIDGYVEKNNPEIFSEKESTQISVICPQPYFHRSGVPNTFTFGTRTAEFEFPFSNESLTQPLLEMGHLVYNEEINVVYDGEVDTGFLLHIHATGDVVNPRLISTKLNRKIEIDTTKVSKILGSPLSFGDDIYVSTVQGSKAAYVIRKGKRYNILNALSRDMTWLNLQPGDNRFRYTADTGAINMQMEIIYRTLFEGV